MTKKTKTETEPAPKPVHYLITQDCKLGRKGQVLSLSAEQVQAHGKSIRKATATEIGIAGLRT